MSTYEPFDIAASAERAEQSKLAVRTRAEQFENDIKSVMALEHGRRFVFSLLENTGVFRSSFSTDPYAVAFAEGGRNIGLRLLAVVQAAAPADARRMNEENLVG